MNEEIRKIIEGYITDGDYEKALSLLMHLPLEEDSDKDLLETCKQGFTKTCTTAITDAVKAKDMAAATRILESYTKLMGEDVNATLFRTLAESIPTQNPVPPTIDQKSKTAFSMAQFVADCASQLRNKVLGLVYIVLAIAAIICGCTGDPTVAIYAAAIILPLALAVPAVSSRNNLFKPIAILLSVIPLIALIVYFKDGSFEYVSHSGLSIPWFWSAIYIVIYNLLIPKKSWLFRLVFSVLLFTIFNPLWYCTKIPGTVETTVSTDSFGSYHTYNTHFSDSANMLIILAMVITIGIYYISLAHIDYQGVWQSVKRHKKAIGKTAASVAGLLVIVLIGAVIKTSYDIKIAREQAIEQARQDSIQAAERARLAAIERERQRAREAAERREQARRDSIDYAEHAGFVERYSRLGIIVTNMDITRGVNDDNVPTKGVKYTIFNPTHKTIKYVIVSAYAVNQFDDRISLTERLRGMGPVAPHEYGSWDFDDVFTDRNGVIDDINVSIRVEYTNGSAKNVALRDVYVSDIKSSWFRNR